MASQSPNSFNETGWQQQKAMASCVLERIRGLLIWSTVPSQLINYVLRWCINYLHSIFISYTVGKPHVYPHVYFNGV